MPPTKCTYYTKQKLSLEIEADHSLRFIIVLRVQYLLLNLNLKHLSTIYGVR